MDDYHESLDAWYDSEFYYDDSIDMRSETIETMNVIRITIIDAEIH